MLEFTKYSKIKDFVCISYFGQNDEYLIQLKIIKPIIEEKYKGLKILIALKDEKVDIFKDENYIIKRSELRNKMFDFGYFIEIKFNGKNHPIEDFLKKIGIENIIVKVDPICETTKRCVIVTKGNYPTINIDDKIIKLLKNVAMSDGYETVVDSDTTNADLVMGVESYELFEAASRGIKTRLYPTGLGTNLYKRMFCNAEVLPSYYRSLR